MYQSGPFPLRLSNPLDIGLSPVGIHLFAVFLQILFNYLL